MKNFLGWAAFFASLPMVWAAEPVIHAPRDHGGPVISVADFGAQPDGSACSWAAFRRAIEECRRTDASKLLIPKGRYVFRDPEILSRPGAHLPLDGIDDLVVEGSGSELIFRHIRPVMSFANSRRILVRNFSVDWEIDLAVPGRIEEAGDGKVLKIAEGFPYAEGERIGTVTEYDSEATRWKRNPVEVYKPDAKLIAPGVWASEAFRKFPAGSAVVARKFVYEAHAFLLDGAGTGDLAFEDVTIFSCPGMAFSGAWCDRGFRFSRCTIRRKDDPRRLISAAADGIWFGGAKGDILVEECDFSHQGDDAVNLHGAWVTITSRPSPRAMELAYKWGRCPSFEPGEIVKLRRAGDLSIVQTARVVSVERDSPESRTCTVTLDADLEPSLELGDFVENTARACANFVIRGNYFHDNRARGLLLQAPGGLVENNRIANTMCAAMQVTTDARYWHEGFASENVVIRGNTMEGCNYAVWDRHAKGRHPACLNVVADTVSGLSAAAVHSNIVIEHNTIKDTPGLAILVTSASDVIIKDNTIIDANTEPFNGAGSGIGLPVRGSVMVARASGVTLSGNTFTADRKVYDQGVFVDPDSTKDIVLQQ